MTELQKFKHLVGDSAVVPHMQNLRDAAQNMQTAPGFVTFEVELQDAIENALALADALIKVRDQLKHREFKAETAEEG